MHNMASSRNADLLQRSNESHITRRGRLMESRLLRRLVMIWALVHRRFKRTGNFWRIPPEIRRKIFEMAFSDQMLLLKAPSRRASEIQGYIYYPREEKALNNLLVCKEFYAEASKVLLDTATFVFLGDIWNCEQLWWNPQMKAAISALTLVTHPRNLQRIRNFQLSGADLRYLISQSLLFHMELHRIVLDHCSPEDLGFTAEQSMTIESYGEGDCSALTDRRRCGRYDLSFDLPYVPGVRDLEVPQDDCRTCVARGRVCKSRLIQMEMEMSVLRVVLEEAEEKQNGGQVRALRTNMEKKQRVWEDAFKAIVESKAKQAKTEAQD